MGSLVGVRVLIVEDEALVAMTVEDFLLDAGAEIVAVAATVAGAMALLDQGRPEAVVLDLNLAGESALPIAARIEELGLACVVASAYGRPGLMGRFCDMPVLQKPYDPAALASTLVVLLSQVAQKAANPYGGRPAGRRGCPSH